MQPGLSNELHSIRDRHWWYRARREILYKIARQHIQGAPQGPILDLGSGPSTNRALIAKFGRTIVALDSDFDSVKVCADEGYLPTMGSANSLPFSSDSFAVVVALDVLEHLQDDASALEEIHRVLMPGGTLLVTVPAYDVLWGWQDDVSGHFRRYSPAQLKRSLQASGHDLIRCTCINMILSIPILLVRKILNKTGIPPRSENRLTPGWLNPFLYAVFATEMMLVNRMDIPWGTSIVSVARARALRDDRGCYD